MNVVIKNVSLAVLVVVKVVTNSKIVLLQTQIINFQMIIIILNTVAMIMKKDPKFLILLKTHQYLNKLTFMLIFVKILVKTCCTNMVLTIMTLDLYPLRPTIMGFMTTPRPNSPSHNLSVPDTMLISFHHILVAHHITCPLFQHPHPHSISALSSFFVV